MNKEKIKVLKRIFSDAHIIDIDMSEWDKQISLCILSDHYADRINTGRLPVLIVNFLRVHQFDVQFNHYAIELDDIDAHFQWRTDSLDIKKNDRKYNVSIFGDPDLPILKMSCEFIHFEEISIDYLDKRFPGWDKPSSPFARPGILKLIVTV